MYIPTPTPHVKPAVRTQLSWAYTTVAKPSMRVIDLDLFEVLFELLLGSECVRERARSSHPPRITNALQSVCDGGDEEHQ